MPRSVKIKILCKVEIGEETVAKTKINLPQGTQSASWRSQGAQSFFVPFVFLALCISYITLLNRSLLRIKNIA
jgi:hypothetical protein